MVLVAGRFKDVYRFSKFSSRTGAPTGELSGINSPTVMEFEPFEVDSSKDDLDPELANHGSSALHGQCESCGGRLIPHS